MKYYLGVLILGCLLLSGCSVSNLNRLDQINTSGPISGVSATKLDLSNQNLTKIPGYVFSQTNLEELNVSNNRLTGSIQAEIRQLKNLKVLNASNNQLSGVPAEIGQLEKLQVVDLSNNLLTGLPYELGNLKNLQTLNISGNKYSEADLGVIMKGLPGGVNVIK